MKLHVNLPVLMAGAVIASAFLAGCADKKGKSDKDSRPSALEMTETYVDTMSLVMTPFDNQTVCNGKLRALSASELSFAKPGVISRIAVREGQRVAKGALIATIDDTERRREVERAEHELEKARVAFVDHLIGLGYQADMKDVPDDVKKRAEITSGYYGAKYDLQSAKTALAECELRAPSAGRIASIEGKLHQTSEKVCTLIDDSAFDVEFQVLEAELSNIKEGDEVTVSPFVNDSLMVAGRVVNINPRVDDKGLVKVVARVAGGNRQLLDGMNMRVVVNRRVEKAFTVPKDAVVERDGYHVVFLLVGGRARWTYVDIVHSNINSFAITGNARKETELKEGDVVITSGNLNLAEGTEVKVRKKK